MSQSITDLKVGYVVKHDSEPYVILTNSFMRTAQRKPVMRTKLRNLISGRVMEKTYTSGEAFEMADIQRTKAQYLYKDPSDAYFMDLQNFEQFPISLEILGERIDFLKDGEETVVTRYEDKPINIELPPKVVLKVVETTPGLRGDTAQGGTKAAKMETGLTLQVPLFINEGDMIRLNTETGEYVERA